MAIHLEQLAMFIHVLHAALLYACTGHVCLGRGICNDISSGCRRKSDLGYAHVSSQSTLSVAPNDESSLADGSSNIKLLMDLNELCSLATSGNRARKLAETKAGSRGKDGAAEGGKYSPPLWKDCLTLGSTGYQALLFPFDCRCFMGNLVETT